MAKEYSYKDGFVNEDYSEDLDQEKVVEAILKCIVDYGVYDHLSNIASRGEGEAQLFKENLTIAAGVEDKFNITYRDIDNIKDSNYTIELTLSSENVLIIKSLGYKYEDFLRTLCSLRSDMLVKDMLMDESMLKSGLEADYQLFSEDELCVKEGECKIRLCETALVIVPIVEDPIRVPYSLIDKISTADYSISIAVENGERIILKAMGRNYDPFCRDITDSINKLNQKVYSFFKEYMPSIKLQDLNSAIRYIREGKAARKKDIDLVSEVLWSEMEKKVEISGMAMEYNFLKSLGQEQAMCIGIKRGLLGDLTREYLWALIPVYDTENKEIGNAIAMESISEDGGRATYFFRITGQSEYSEIKDMDELDKKVDKLIRLINYSMISINFRREPIYLTDNKLDEPRYISYKTAIKKIPALRTLRENFIGRVIHSSYDQWSRDVLDLLKFNVNPVTGSAKWNKRKENKSL